MPLLAADTLSVTEAAKPERMAGRSRILSFVSAAVGALVVLIWLGTSGPGFLGYGTSLLWGGIPKGELAPYYDITVQPGNHTVRRRSDQMISARKFSRAYHGSGESRSTFNAYPDILEHW